MVRHSLVALCAAILFVSTSARAETIDPAAVCPKASTTIGSVKVDARQVCTLLVVVRNTLNKLEDQLKVPGRPQLKSVNLIVKAASDTAGGGSITLFVINFGQQTTASSVQTLTIGLSPKKETTPAAATAPPFSTKLANAITAALVAIDLSGVDLTTESLSLSVRFGVKKATTGGVAGKLELIPITFSAGGSISSDDTQELVFTFGQKEEKKKDS